MFQQSQNIQLYMSFSAQFAEELRKRLKAKIAGHELDRTQGLEKGIQDHSGLILGASDPIPSPKVTCQRDVVTYRLGKGSKNGQSMRTYAFAKPSVANGEANVAKIET